MGYQFSLVISPFLAILLVFCLSIVLRYRKESIARPLALLLIMSLWLLVMNACELVASTPTLKLLFSRLGYGCLLFIPVALMSFCLRYTGYVRFTRFPLLALALAVPVFSLFAYHTNDLHHQFWRSVTFPVVNGLGTIKAEYGLLFWLSAAYSYLTVGASVITIFRSYFFAPGIFRRQSMIIVVGVIIPGLLNILYLMRLLPPGFNDLTSIGYAIAGILFSWGLFINRFLRVLPVSRTVILDEIDIGVILFNREGFLIDLNKAVSRWTGMSHKEIGLHVNSLPAVLELVGMDSVPLPFPEWEGVRQADDKLFSIRIGALYGGLEREAGYVVTMNDITDRMRQVEELSQLRAQLVRSDKLASIGQIAAGVAHEINNPLGYLSSEFRSLKSLLEKSGNSFDIVMKKDLDAIMTSAEDGLDRIGSVVRNLIAFSRHETEQNTFELFDLNNGIKGTLEICRSEYRGIASIELDLGKLPLIRSRKNEINQVILNIITNAAHAIKTDVRQDRSGKFIRIRTLYEDGKVICDIANNGPPIPDSIRDRIFDSFFTTNSNSGGTGLGLSIAKDIIEKRHGGTIRLVSADPVSFRIVLPTETAKCVFPNEPVA